MYDRRPRRVASRLLGGRPAGNGKILGEVVSDRLSLVLEVGQSESPAGQMNAGYPGPPPTQNCDGRAPEGGGAVAPNDGGVSSPFGSPFVHGGKMCMQVAKE